MIKSTLDGGSYRADGKMAPFLSNQKHEPAAAAAAGRRAAPTTVTAAPDASECRGRTAQSTN